MRKLLVLLAAVAFVVAFTVPAMAGDWAFYGSARMLTYMQDVDNPGATFDDSDLIVALDSVSRIGAKVKAGNVTGRFEYSAVPAMRLLYGKVNLGGGTLLVGQDYTPIKLNVHSLPYVSSLSGYGRLYSGRVPQLKLTMGGFQLALLPASAPGGVITNSTEQDTSLPKIEVRYDIKFGAITVSPVLGYNSYDDVDNADKSQSIDSTVYGVGLKYSAGPLTVAADVFSGTNLTDYGTISQGEKMSPCYTGTGVEDAETMGYAAAVQYKVSDTVKFDVGYGIQNNEISVVGVTTEDTCSAMYAAVEIKLANGLIITPLVGVRDLEDIKVGSTTTNQKSTTYFGAEWKINF